MCTAERLGWWGPMAVMTGAMLLEALRSEVPEIAPVIDEHTDFYGEVLLHVLFGDVSRFVEEAYADGRSDVEHRCLDLFDRALREGDAEVENVISVSFVENTEPWTAATRAWLETWPPGLRAEAKHRFP